MPIAPIEQREIKFTRKLLKMYGKGATMDECYQFCCSEHYSIIQRMEYEEPRATYRANIRYLTIHTINHKLKLVFTNER